MQCVFEHKSILDDGSTETTKGYSDHTGPSLFCTGSAFSGKGVNKMLLCACAVIVFSFMFLGGGENDSLFSGTFSGVEAISTTTHHKVKKNS